MKKTSNRRVAKAKRRPAPETPVETPRETPPETVPEMPPETCSAPPDAPALIRLEHSLQIKDVEAAHRQFLAALDGGGAVTVDLARLGAIDTAGIQLMLAFTREAARRGIALEVRGDSAALTQALTVLGLRDAFAVATPP